MHNMTIISKKVKVNAYSYERNGKVITVAEYYRTVRVEQRGRIKVKGYTYLRGDKRITVKTHYRTAPVKSKPGIKTVKAHDRNGQKVKAYKRTLPEPPSNRYVVSKASRDGFTFYIKHKSTNSLKKQLDNIEKSKQYSFRRNSQWSVRTYNDVHAYSPFISKRMSALI